MIVDMLAAADFHTGRLDPDDQRKEMQLIIDKAQEIRPKFFFVAGDFMDHRVALNSKEAALMIWFFTELNKIENMIIILIHGTYEHDANQLKTLGHLVSDRFYIFNKVTQIKVGDLNLGIIPEEYMTDPDEYYKDFMKPKEKYDFIVGHGTFSHVAFNFGKKTKRRQKRITYPVFKYEDMEPLVNGLILFGHYHIKDIHKRMIYLGSYSRYQHGEEEPKGYWYFKYDTNKKSLVHKEFFENILAKKFTTIKESDCPKDYKEMVRYLEKKNSKVYRLRISYDKNKIDEKRYNDIISFWKSHQDTTLHKIGKREEKREKEQKEEDTRYLEKINKYGSMNWVDATSAYLKDEKKINMEPKEIREILEQARKGA